MPKRPKSISILPLFFCHIPFQELLKIKGTVNTPLHCFSQKRGSIFVIITVEKLARFKKIIFALD